MGKFSERMTSLAARIVSARSARRAATARRRSHVAAMLARYRAERQAFFSQWRSATTTADVPDDPDEEIVVVDWEGEQVRRTDSG
jgi:hypothetical protein